MAKKNYDQMAAEIIEKVGGKDNIFLCFHCITRLRFNVKDMSLIEAEEVKKIPGVLGAQVVGDQFQIIIGQDVANVYDAICNKTGLAKEEAIDENLDGAKEKLTPKKIGGIIMDYLSGSMIQLIPVLIAAGMFKTITSICGPQLLKLFAADSNTYILLDFVFDAGFYFLPILLGYAAAKKLKTSPILGMYLGAILIAPDFVNLVASATAASRAGEAAITFSVFGIPAPLLNYAQSVVPILLSVPVMAVIEKFLKKYIPAILSTIFVPFLTMLIMLPVSFCLLAPLGNIVGNYIGVAVVWIGNTFGFIGCGIVAALYQLLVMTGMHTVVNMTMIGVYIQQGYIDGPFMGMMFAMFSTFGCALGAMLRLKNQEEKGAALGCFVSGIVGGVTEPTIFGICMKYKRTWLGQMAGAAAGAIYANIVHVIAGGAGASNFLLALGFTQHGTTNMVNGFIALAIAFMVAVVVTYLFGFSKQELLSEG